MQLAKLNDWFSLLQIPCHTAPEPGQYVEINQQRFYIAGYAQQLVEFIVPNDLCEVIMQRFNENYTISGEGIGPPQKNAFYLWQAHNQGISACVFYFKRYRQYFNGLVLMGTDESFPFNPCPSRMLIPDMPQDAIAALPLFEDWQIPNRLANLQFSPGCFQGSVQDLAKHWLSKNENRVDFCIDIA